MVEGNKLPSLLCVAGRALRTESAIVDVVLLVAVNAGLRRPLEDLIDMAALTGHIDVFP